jgi:hypothetical protein
MASWVVPFFIIGLIRYSLFDYFTSFIPFFVTFVIYGITGLLLNSWNQSTGFWSNYGVWKRYFLLVGMYSLAAILTVISIMALDSIGLARYFGGDAGGSFGLLFFPSMIFYIVIGVPVAMLVKIAYK